MRHFFLLYGCVIIKTLDSSDLLVQRSGKIVSLMLHYRSSNELVILVAPVLHDAFHDNERFSETASKALLLAMLSFLFPL